jgi:hypothetical protein
MRRSRIGLAVIALATVLSSAGPAFGRIHLGPLGFIFSRILPHPRFHGRHSVARATRYAGVNDATNAYSRADEPKATRELSDPAARAQMSADAALAGWHGNRGAEGWWRHDDGEYGWVGPLFWPFAYYDIYEYAISGDDSGFWDYGYADIYAGLFAPYGNDDLNGYLAPQRRSTRLRGAAAALPDLCGKTDSESAGLPVAQIRDAIQPTDAQRATVDDLAKASIKSAQTIAAACGTQTALRAALTAPGRLAMMQHRVEAMTAAVELIRPPLETLYGMLDDAQKARLNGLSDDQRKTAGIKISRGGSCEAGRGTATPWPAREIESIVHPNDSQTAALQTVQKAAARAAEILTAACPNEDATTVVARIESVDRRLDAMRQAINVVQDALGDFYQSLNGEQKNKFEAIGPRRTAS